MSITKATPYPNILGGEARKLGQVEMKWLIYKRVTMVEQGRREKCLNAVTQHWRYKNGVVGIGDGGGG